MVNGKSIGLVCLDTIHYPKTLYAIKKTLKNIDIDKIYWISDKYLPELDSIKTPEGFGVPVQHIFIPTIKNYILEYNNIYINLLPYILGEENFFLNIHSDGFAVNKNSWDNRFLDYDYIGAPWPFCLPGQRVGNGGFSLRSKKLYDSLKYIDTSLKLQYIHGSFGEDVIICRNLDSILKTDFGIKFCSEELSAKFSMELSGTMFDYWIGKSFGFHGGFVCEHYGYNYSELK